MAYCLHRLDCSPVAANRDVDFAGSCHVKCWNCSHCSNTVWNRYLAKDDIPGPGEGSAVLKLLGCGHDKSDQHMYTLFKFLHRAVTVIPSLANFSRYLCPACVCTLGPDQQENENDAQCIVPVDAFVWAAHHLMATLLPACISAHSMIGMYCCHTAVVLLLWQECCTWMIWCV